MGYQWDKKKDLEINENEHTTTPNLWDTEKVLRGKFIAIQGYLKKQEKSQINKLTLHLKKISKKTTTNRAQSK